VPVASTWGDAHEERYTRFSQFLQFWPNAPREVTARFTFVYRKVEDEWLIAEHHSSVLPESA